METRKDYGPMGCAGPSAKLLALFTLVLVLLRPSRRK